jgi:hypothetical protein
LLNITGFSKALFVLDGGIMKTLCAFAIGLALIFSASAAYATPAPIDPTIILRDPACSPSTLCTVVSGSFGLQLDSTGGGSFLVQNNSGFTWTSLSLSLLAPSNESVFGCDGGVFFQNCSIGITGPGSNGTNVVDAFFSGLGPCQNGSTNCQGIPNGGGIVFDLNTVCAPTATCGNWEPNSLVTVTANSTPEPESLVLLLTGFLPLLPLRKKLFNSRSSA